MQKIQQIQYRTQEAKVGILQGIRYCHEVLKFAIRIGLITPKDFVINGIFSVALCLSMSIYLHVTEMRYISASTPMVISCIATFLFYFSSLAYIYYYKYHPLHDTKHNKFAPSKKINIAMGILALTSFILFIQFEIIDYFTFSSNIYIFLLNCIIKNFILCQISGMCLFLSLNALVVFISGIHCEKSPDKPSETMRISYLPENEDRIENEEQDNDGIDCTPDLDVADCSKELVFDGANTDISSAMLTTYAQKANDINHPLNLD